MEHIAAILLLLGCSDDGRVCTELPAPQIGYETVQACEQDTPRALSGAGSSHPLVLSKCIAVDPLAEGDMEIVWDINERGELLASVVPYNGGGVDEETVVAGLEGTGKAARLR